MKQLKGIMKTNATQPAAGFEHNPERDGAFTLTELLVVMAVLAVLAALMAPALARSGDNGRTVCLNNMRQLGAALNLYAAENHDSLPWPNWGNDCPRRVPPDGSMPKS